jgi:competence protein ComEA
MLKKILVLLAMLYASVTFAAVEVNKATAAELDALKGIGPGISSRIVDERKKGDFKDWNDFISRVKGVGEVTAGKFSAEGLTVNGGSYKGVAATPATAKKDDKATAKPAAAPASAPAADPKADAKAKKEADKKAKAEEKQKKADDAKAKKEADKKAKADAAKPAAAAASAPALAASAAKK